MNKLPRVRGQQMCVEKWRGFIFFPLSAQTQRVTIHLTIISALFRRT